MNLEIPTTEIHSPLLSDLSLSSSMDDLDHIRNMQESCLQARKETMDIRLRNFRLWYLPYYRWKLLVAAHQGLTYAWLEIGTDMPTHFLWPAVFGRIQQECTMLKMHLERSTAKRCRLSFRLTPTIL